MKKAVLILSVFLFIFFTGCSQLPEGFTQESYDTGMNAIKTIDQYITGEIEKDEAQEKLERFSRVLEIYSDDMESSGGSKFSEILKILATDCHFASLYISSGNTEKLISIRDEMAVGLEDPDKMLKLIEERYIK